MTNAYAEKVLNYERSQIGYSEGENNHNKYAAEVGHADHQPWCCTFQNASFKASGLWSLIPNHSAYTPTSFQGFKAAGQSIALHDTRLWQPGDLIYFQFPGSNRIDHIAMLEKVLSALMIQTIEGNTNQAGSRSGGMVLRKARKSSMVAGVGRPKWPAGLIKPSPPAPPKPHAAARNPYGQWTSSPGDHGSHVMFAQWALGIPVTGVYDKVTEDTVKRYQSAHHLVDPVYGAVGNATSNSLATITH